MRGVTAVSNGQPAAGLAELQALFARLCTDATLLAAFESDPAAVARDALGPSAAALEDVDLARLRHYAESLRWKRLREARRFVPFTAHALGPGFEAEFLAYTRGSVPAGIRRPLADAMAFARTVATSRAADRPSRQAARYDSLRLNLHFRLVRHRRRQGISAHRRRTPWIRLALFDYPFASIDPADAGQTSGQRRLTPTLFASIGGRSGIWYW